ncbi:MAG: ABC transporter ATP-binding protein [Euryarchaeota archaeon]|nr:ABC transporter ATP-binding protein [Euryarchaeota archaeon]MDE1835147.1 ABC transporter ATP-binding protein [Euryarchaeota archaeon]MDE1881460.1 ABC transporter ATP-binding protein [Euryarchaeota archaeon]MDE2046204.1 ABC transporter ATP-binding protein [Thermoplasmata archaeon]
MSPLLEAQDLTKRFNSFTALDHADFRYEGAGAIGYLGPNGAGKTTTLKLFTDLLRPTTGHALIDGIDVTADPKRALWNVGALIETPEPYPSQTGREALRMIGEYRGLTREEIRDRTERYAAELELPDLDRKTAKLSKGQKQRIVLAGILLAEPTVLLLDEPTSGLDPAERVVIRNILVRLKGEQRLILMSSHLLQEVTEICDRVIFINKGKILLQDSVQNIGIKFRVTRLDVEFAKPLEPSVLTTVPGVSKVEVVSPTRFRLDFDGDDGTRARILEACQKVAPVTSFSSASLNLEDAYLKLIQGGS